MSDSLHRDLRGNASMMRMLFLIAVLVLGLLGARRLNDRLLGKVERMRAPGELPAAAEAVRRISLELQ